MVHLVIPIGLYLFFVPNNLFSPTLRPSDDDDPSLALTTPPDGDFILDPDATRVPCAFRFLYGSDAATFDNFASHVLHTMMRCAKGKKKKEVAIMRTTTTRVGFYSSCFSSFLVYR